MIMTHLLALCEHNPQGKKDSLHIENLVLGKTVNFVSQLNYSPVRNFVKDLVLFCIYIYKSTHANNWTKIIIKIVMSHGHSVQSEPLNDF